MNRLTHEVFVACPGGLPGRRVSSQLRHVIEFYECFLNGLAESTIDYDARRRDPELESGPTAAAARIEEMIDRLENEVPGEVDDALTIRCESAWLPSTVSRELHALSSHTIHHFALIAIMLELHGVAVDADFGVSSSTLEFQAALLS